MENKMWLTLGSTALGCLIAGFGGGFWLGKKKTEFEAFHVANMEIAREKEHYATYYAAKYEEKLAAITADNLQLLEGVGDDAVQVELKTTEHLDPEVTERQLGHYEQMLQEDVEETDRLHKLYDKASQDPPQEEVVRPKPPVPIANPRRERPIVDYRGQFKAEKLVEQPVEEKATDDPVDKMAPYDIPEEMYYEGDANYQQRQLNWYAPDDVLTNMKDEPIEEPYLLVGDCLDVFAEKDDEDNIIYVCNPKLMLVLRIDRIHESFAESVQGLMR